MPRLPSKNPLLSLTREREQSPLSHTCSYNEPAAIHNDILNSAILLFRNKKTEKKKNTLAFYELVFEFEYLIIRKRVRHMLKRA